MAGGTIIQKFFTGLGGLFNKRFWHVSLTAIFILIYLFEGILMSFSTASFQPFWDSFLERVVNVDQSLYDNVDTIKSEGGIPVEEGSNWWQVFTSYVSTYWNIFFSLWFMFWLWLLAYIFWKKFNTSAEWASAGLAFLTLAFLITFGNVITVLGTGELTGATAGDVAVRIAPFKGVWSLLTGLPDLVHPAYQVASSPAMQSVDVII